MPQAKEKIFKQSEPSSEGTGVFCSVLLCLPWPLFVFTHLSLPLKGASIYGLLARVWHLAKLLDIHD